MLHNAGITGIGGSGRLNLHAKQRETKQKSRMMMMMNKMLKQQKAAAAAAAAAQPLHHHQKSLLSTLNTNEIARLKQKWMKMKPMEHAASLGELSNASPAAVAQLGNRTHHLLRKCTPRFRTGNTTKHHRRSPDRLIGYGRPYGGGGGYPPLIPTTKNSYSIWSRAQFQDQLSRFPTLAKWCPKTILPNGTHVWQYPNHAPSVLCIAK